MLSYLVNQHYKNGKIKYEQVFKNDETVSGKSFDENGNFTSFDEGC